jgi:hypothetical protein
MKPRSLAAALAGAAVLTSALTLSPSAGAEEGTTTAAAASPLVLRAPETITARSHDGWVYSDLDVTMRAAGSPFEIRAQRLPSEAPLGIESWWDPSYNSSEITATWTQWDAEGNALEGPSLPAGAMSTWQGLDDFVSVQVFRDGQTEPFRDLSATGCFNGWAVKAGPEGPASSEYPWSCPWNPYTLGSVMGISEDYSTSLLPEWGVPLRLKPGTYTMKASIAPAWREFFGITEAEGAVTRPLVVKEARRNWREAERTVPSGTDQLEETAEAPTTASAGELVDAHAPDLRSLPAFGMNLNAKGTSLRFGATVWNGGNGPLVIEGFRDDTSVDHMAAYQYYFDGDGNQTGHELVGEMHYHEANHNHWHFEDFARYRLMKADAEGNLTAEEAVPSTKASFCLVATDAVDLTVPNAEMRPHYTDLGSQCGGRDALWLREVLANGHGDTYHQYRAGQAFRVGNLDDGIYYVAVEANPDNEDGRNLQELDLTNNDSYRKIKLWTTPKGVRKVKAFKVGVVDEYYGGEFRRAARP